MPRPAYNWAYETTDPETLHADIQAAADDNQSAYAFNRIRRGLEVLSDPSFTQLVGDLAVRRTEIDDGTGNWADLYALVIEERAARTPNE
jgi:hypothetical protein